MDIAYIPIILTAVAFSIYTYFFYKKITKLGDTYYHVIFASIRAMLIIPFWGFALTLMLYMAFPKAQVFLNNEFPDYQTVVITNDSDTIQSYYFLKNDKISTVIERDFYPDTTIIEEHWTFAYHTGIYDFAISETVESKTSDTFAFMLNKGTKDKIVVVKENVADSTLKATEVYANAYNADGSVYAVYDSDFKEKRDKITPNINFEFKLFLFFLVVLYAATYHIYLISGGWLRRSLLYTASAIVIAPICWLIFSYGRILWIYFNF